MYGVAGVMHGSARSMHGRVKIGTDARPRRSVYPDSDAGAERERKADPS
jgi:hypothetical protein